MTALVETSNDESRDLLNGTAMTTDVAANGEQDHHHHDNGTNGTSTDDDHDDQVETLLSRATPVSGRTGTTSSARFNLLSTMVGGGSLSLPLAFQKTGNILLGPLLLIVIAALTEFCFRILATSARVLSPVRDDVQGKDSFESISQAAFGRWARSASMGLVVLLCFFGTVAYSVLIRDLASTFFPQQEEHHQHQPQQYSSLSLFASDKSSNDGGPNWTNNLAMLAVVLFVTPVCTLRTLTALERFGAASMLSIGILGFCIVYRSVECNLTDKFAHVRKATSWWNYVTYGPQSAKDVLDALPLFVSCFVCHYTVPLVQNELARPTPARVSWWLRSTTWLAASFYLIMGIAGSSYGNCTADGHVHGNILLDFAEDDPLLLVGRICLAVTVTLAFPMLVIPARDILIRAFVSEAQNIREELVVPLVRPTEDAAIRLEEGHVDTSATPQSSLREPLLDHQANAAASSSEVAQPPATEASFPSFNQRLAAAMIFFWAAAALACCVKSIDVVWDLLGSSLSILVSYIIPSLSFLMIMRKYITDDDDDENNLRSRLSKVLAWVLVIVFTPLMFISTGNAVYNMIRSNGS